MAGSNSIQNDIIIRPLHPDDAADQYEIVTHPAVLRMLLQLPSMEFAETVEWIKKSHPGRHRLVTELSGKVIASAHITQFQNPRLSHAGRLGIMVHPDYWGQGIGSRLLSSTLSVADDWLNLKRVELEVYTDNIPAIQLYQKFGFVTEGIRQKVAFGDGQWLDDMVMARLHGAMPATNRIAQASTQSGASPVSSQLPKSEISIRPVRSTDVDQIYYLFRHAAVARTTLQLPSQEISTTQERINNRPPGLYRYVATHAENEILGMISLYQPQNPRQLHSAGLGMMVHPKYWGQGIGSRLMAAILDLADNWLNLKRIELEVNTDNPAGIRLYEKFGFVIEGTKRLHAYGDGRWADSYFMARVR